MKYAGTDVFYFADDEIPKSGAPRLLVPAFEVAAGASRGNAGCYLSIP